jgi:hypothetical protein
MPPAPESVVISQRLNRVKTKLAPFSGISTGLVRVMCQIMITSWFPMITLCTHWKNRQGQLKRVIHPSLAGSVSWFQRFSKGNRWTHWQWPDDLALKKTHTEKNLINGPIGPKIVLQVIHVHCVESRLKLSNEHQCKSLPSPNPPAIFATSSWTMCIVRAKISI